MAKKTKNCEGKCPYCNSDDIDYTEKSAEWHDDGMLFFCYCLICGKEFEQYCTFEYEETRFD